MPLVLVRPFRGFPNNRRRRPGNPSCVPANYFAVREIPRDRIMAARAISGCRAPTVGGKRWSFVIPFMRSVQKL